MDIYQALKKDHRKAKDLFSRLLKTTLNKISREDIFGKLKAILESHHEAEEEVFYAALNQERSVGHVIENAVEQHEEVVYTLEEIEEINVYDQDWQEKITGLRDYLKEHIKVEEGALFLESKKLFSEKKAQELALQFIKAKERH